MTDEEKLINVLDKTAALLRSAQPIAEHGCEVCEYVIPAEVYLQALHAVADFRGMDASEMKDPMQAIEVAHDC